MNDNSQSNTAGRKQPTGNLWRVFKIAALVVVAILVIIWIGFWLQHRLTHVTTSDARVATNEITVSSRLAGKIDSFTIMQGDYLHSGAIVAQLYAKPARLKLAGLKAQVARMQAQIAVQEKRHTLAQAHLTGGIKQTGGMLETDIAAAHAAKAKMQKAHSKARRAAKLFGVHAATEQQRDSTRYTYKAAKAAYQQAQSRVAVDKIALANARTGMLSRGMSVPSPAVLKSKLAVAKSNLQQAQAELAHQRNRIDDLTVRSPINGVVDMTFVEQDEYVSPGQPILMMHDPGNVWIAANIKATKVAALAIGQPVVIQVDAYPDTKYTGHIKVIGHAATNQFALLPNPNPSGNFTKITQRIPVRIAIDDGHKKQLAPGMMVEVDVDITAHGDQQSPANKQ